MIALQCFVLVVLAAPFKSKSRLEAENAVLRHQLIVLQRKVQRRLRLTNNDRWLFSQLMAILHGDNPHLHLYAQLGRRSLGSGCHVAHFFEPFEREQCGGIGAP